MCRVVVGIGLLVTVFTGGVVISHIRNESTISNNSDAVAILDNSEQAINYSDYAYLGGFIGFFISLLVFSASQYIVVPGIIYFLMRSNCSAVKSLCLNTITI